MERRRQKRHGKRVSVRYGEADLEHGGFTKNLSQGGAFIAGGKLPAPGTRLHLQLLLGSRRSVFLEAVVSRQRQVPQALRQIEPAGFGVRFLQPAEVVGEVLSAGGRSNEFEVPVATAAALGALFRQQLDRGGIFVKTDRRLERDAPVLVRLALEFAARTFEYSARVVQVLSGQGLALAFEDLPSVQEQLRPFAR